MNTQQEASIIARIKAIEDQILEVYGNTVAIRREPTTMLPVPYNNKKSYI